MDVVEIQVAPRKAIGKSAQKTLRRQGRIPAVIYGSDRA